VTTTLSRWLVRLPAGLGLASSVLLLAVIGLLMFEQLVAAKRTRLLISHAYDLLIDLNRLGILVRDAERGQRGYVLTGRVEYLEPYRMARTELAPTYEHLRRLLAGASGEMPKQAESAEALWLLIQRKLAEMAETVQLRADLGEDAAKRVIETDLGRTLMRQIAARSEAMTSDVTSLVAGRNAEMDGEEVRLRWLSGGGSGAAVLMAVLALFVSRRVAAQQREIERAADHHRELERSNADLAQFAFAAAHDLRAPLRAIGHLAEWIGEDLAAKASAETLENLALLRGRVARLDMLLNGLLAYARIGHEGAEVEDLDVADMVRDIAAVLAPRPGFTVACEGPMPRIRTYRAPLRMVLDNLISNALKHHDRAEGRVTVAMKLAGGEAEFRVADDGPGIPPQFHERVFGVFQTLKSRDEVESSGMGLAIVKKQVERHGGRIRVESEPPARGTTFVFTWKESAV
jgi:signal transduction histidine kinase